MPAAPKTIEGLRAERAAERITSMLYETHELEDIFVGKSVGIHYFDRIALLSVHRIVGRLIGQAEESAAEFDELVKK